MCPVLSPSSLLHERAVCEIQKLTKNWWKSPRQMMFSVFSFRVFGDFVTRAKNCSVMLQEAKGILISTIVQKEKPNL